MHCKLHLRLYRFDVKEMIKMITSKSEITEALKEYEKVQREYTYFLYSSNAPKWDAKKHSTYLNGIVLGKFQENDFLTMQLLKEGVSDSILCAEIKASLEHQIQKITNAEQPDILKQMLLKSYKSQISELSLNSLDIWICKNVGWIQTYTRGIPYSEFKTLLYLYYSFDNYTYQKRHAFCSDLGDLKEAYRDVFGKQSQFAKYGVVPIDQERELIAINPPRIYDKKLNKTFFTKNVPMILLKKFDEMKSYGIIGDFSIRLVNEPGYDGRLYSQYITESLEQGKIFEFVNLGNCFTSKLYSKEYEDCMWVVIDPQNITFEELCKDFETYNDMVVTQVVHLQYKTECECAYITHMDHEYVFYTIDEYESRMTNPAQKGTAKSRLKSFKIDNSRIPFDYRCNVLRKDENGNNLPVESEQFVYYVLECYFKHRDLLKEYFQEMLN